MLLDVSPMRSSRVWSAGAGPLLTNPLGAADRASWNTSDADAAAATERRAQSLDRANIVHERETDGSCLAWVHV